jgi:beta-lactamase regulating signal transducer with metallopeptidase domain
MSSIEQIVAAHADRVWFLLLTFSVTVALVLALRRPCRKLFGPICAFQLWMMPVVALIVSQLPHKAALQFVQWRDVTQAFTPPANVVAQSAAVAVDWRLIALMVWVAGTLVRGVISVCKQSRYRQSLKGAVTIENTASRWPIMRAANTDVGPALVGIWQTRIVLPMDFDERYDAIERTLILAHETAHAQRRDSWWALLAEVLVALFWFHPLAWMSLQAFRQDQELACDAAVIATHAAQRRAYANAMLKTQTGIMPLPVGCSWTSRHPLTERISMLKQPMPGRLTSRMFRLAIAALMSASSLAVYAGSAPAPTTVLDSELQLNLSLDFQMDKPKNAADYAMNLALCVRPGEPMKMKYRDWTVEATSVADKNGVVTHLHVTDAQGQPVYAPMALQAQLGDAVSGKEVATDGHGLFTVNLIAVTGCPARDASTHSATASTERYMLNVDVAFDDKPGQVHMKQCIKPGEPMLVSGNSDGVPPWSGSFTLQPASAGLVAIQGSLSGGTLTSISHPVVQTKLGQRATVMVGKRITADQGHVATSQMIKIDLLPTAGC